MEAASAQEEPCFSSERNVDAKREEEEALLQQNKSVHVKSGRSGSPSLPFSLRCFERSISHDFLLPTSREEERRRLSLSPASEATAAAGD